MTVVGEERKNKVKRAFYVADVGDGRETGQALEWTQGVHLRVYLQLRCRVRTW